MLSDNFNLSFIVLENPYESTGEIYIHLIKLCSYYQKYGVNCSD